MQLIPNSPELGIFLAKFLHICYNGNEVNHMNRISFKYHPNVWKLGIFKQSKRQHLPHCKCCGNPTEFYLNYIYAKEEVKCICPECVASGKAAERYDGCFIAESEYDFVRDEEKAYELLYCTPGYDSYLGEHWLACCKDYCAFIGYLDSKELEATGIAEELIADYEAHGGIGGLRNHLTKRGQHRGYLFQCLHCGKYRMWADYD